MRSLLKIIILLLLLSSQIFSDAPDRKQLLSPMETLELLEEISPYAITFGSGKKHIHIFIDPYCSVSRNYISFIYKKRERMFPKYKFHFYLYELRRKNSSKTIQTILSSENRNYMLKTIMIDREDIEINNCIDEDDYIFEEIDEIAEVAKSIGVFKRPYILVNGKVR